MSRQTNPFWKELGYKPCNPRLFCYKACRFSCITCGAPRRNHTPDKENPRSASAIGRWIAVCTTCHKLCARRNRGEHVIGDPDVLYQATYKHEVSRVKTESQLKKESRLIDSPTPSFVDDEDEDDEHTYSHFKNLRKEIPGLAGYNPYIPTPEELAKWKRRRQYRWSKLLYSPEKAESLYWHRIKPEQFLDLAAKGRWIQEIKKQGSGGGGWHNYPEYRAIVERMKEGKGVDPLTLWIQRRDCKVIGHEGRHRASIAANEGYKSAPIVLPCMENESEYIPWHKCTRCFKRFPSKLLPQDPHGGAL